MEPSPWLPVYKPGTQELLFKFDPVRRLVQIQERRIKYVIDLTEYKAPGAQKERQEDE